jgi:hypothetical protein
MAHRFDQGFLSHTATARPFWAGDVDVSRLHDAPRLYQVGSHRMSASNGLRRQIARLVTAITGR